MTIFDIRTVRLQSGEQFRDVKEVELEPLELGGQRYVPIPETPEAALTLTRLSSGLMLELELDVRLVGPCMRCLADAGLDVAVQAREYQATTRRTTTSCGRRTSRTTARPLRLGARRGRACAARQDPLPRRLRRPLPGVRPRPERRAARARGAKAATPRWAKLAELQDQL